MVSSRKLVSFRFSVNLPSLFSWSLPPENSIAPPPATDLDESLIPVFRWSRCKQPLPEKLMRSTGFPLPPEHIEVLEDNLDWEDVQWSQIGFGLLGKSTHLLVFIFCLH